MSVKNKGMLSLGVRVCLVWDKGNGMGFVVALMLPRGFWNTYEKGGSELVVTFVCCSWSSMHSSMCVG